MNQTFGQPPTDVGASELFLKLMEAPFPSEVIDFPRVGADGKAIGRLRVRVLSQEDHDRARIIAHEKLAKRNIKADQLTSVTLREVAGDAVAKELLAVACLAEKPAGQDRNGQPIYGRIFVDGDDLSKLMADEVAVLFRAWQLVQKKFGPLPKTVDADAWIKRLEEGGSDLPLALLSLPDVVELASTSCTRVSSLCSTLESQWSTLPGPLRSSLAKFRLGTGYWSARVVDGLDSEASLGSYPHDITIEDAVDLEMTMRRRAHAAAVLEEEAD